MNQAMLALLSRPVVGEMAHSLEQVAKIYSQSKEVNPTTALTIQK